MKNADFVGAPGRLWGGPDLPGPIATGGHMSFPGVNILTYNVYTFSNTCIVSGT